MARTHKQFVVEMQEINTNIEIVGTYKKAVERVKVKCLKCGKIWEPKAYSLIQGKGCPSCSAKVGAINNQGKTGLKTTDQFIKELQTVDEFINVLGEYVNGHTNIKLKCLRCNHIWEAKPYSILQGHGCPRCAKSGTSFMEQFILLSFQEVFGQNSVLSRDRKTIGIELDIYLPELMLAIEPGNWWLHYPHIERDKRKRELCAEKGIKLITIYDKYPANEQPPYNTDCYTFSQDLNTTDHTVIKKLVLELLKISGKDVYFSDMTWEKIEEHAYENAKSMTHEIFVTRIEKIHPNVEIIDRYQNANRRLKVRCNRCGFEWSAVPANLLSGDGCRKCGTKEAHKRFIKKQEDFIKEIAAVNPEVEIIGKYSGRHAPIKTRCRICGYEWEPRASSLLRGSNHKGAKTMHNSITD